MGRIWRLRPARPRRWMNEAESRGALCCITSPTLGSLNPTSNDPVATITSAATSTPESWDEVRPTRSGRDIRPRRSGSSQFWPSSSRRATWECLGPRKSASTARVAAPARVGLPSASRKSSNRRFVTSRSSVKMNADAPKMPGEESSIRAESIVVWIVVDRRLVPDTGSPRTTIAYSRPMGTRSEALGVMASTERSSMPDRREKNGSEFRSVADRPTNTGDEPLRRSASRHLRSVSAT